MRQQDGEFEVHLDCMARPCLSKTKRRKRDGSPSGERQSDTWRWLRKHASVLPTLRLGLLTRTGATPDTRRTHEEHQEWRPRSPHSCAVPTGRKKTARSKMRPSVRAYCHNCLVTTWCSVDIAGDNTFTNKEVFRLETKVKVKEKERRQKQVVLLEASDLDVFCVHH